MPMHMYVALQIDEKIVHLTIDETTGELTKQSEIAATGGPGPMTVRPDKTQLYVGYRGPGEVNRQGKDGTWRPEFGLSSFAIDPKSGELTPSGTRVSTKGEPCFLSTDSRGNYLAGSFFQVGHVGIFPMDESGALGGDPTSWVPTNSGAHSVQIDPSDRYCFVPHIALGNGGLKRLPEGRQTPANCFFMFKFDKATGALAPNNPLKVGPDKDLGPRHFVFHPEKPFLYSCNEQGASVTRYGFNKDTGILNVVDSVSSLPPEGFKERNSMADIHVHPSGKFIYATNRGHGSIVSYRVQDDGSLKPIAWNPAQRSPRSFRIDPSGRFLYLAGLATATSPNSGSTRTPANLLKRKAFISVACRCGFRWSIFLQAKASSIATNKRRLIEPPLLFLAGKRVSVSETIFRITRCGVAARHSAAAK